MRSGVVEELRSWLRRLEGLWVGLARSHWKGSKRGAVVAFVHCSKYFKDHYCFLAFCRKKLNIVTVGVVKLLPEWVDIALL